MRAESGLHRIGIAHAEQSLLAIGAYRFEEAIPAALRHDQRLVDQSSQQVKHGVSWSGGVGADGLYCRQSEAPGEN